MLGAHPVCDDKPSQVPVHCPVDTCCLHHPLATLQNMAGMLTRALSWPALVFTFATWCVTAAAQQTTVVRQPGGQTGHTQPIKTHVLTPSKPPWFITVQNPGLAAASWPLQPAQASTHAHCRAPPRRPCSPRVVFLAGIACLQNNCQDGTTGRGESQVPYGVGGGNT